MYRPNQGYDCTVGKKYKMQINIYKDRADYSVDGWTYAYSYFPAHGDGSIPDEGFFGFAINKKGEHKEIENVVISNIDEESNHMMSFQNVPYHFRLDSRNEKPSDMFFKNVDYDADSKTFSGRIDWRPNSLENGYL